MDHSDKDHLSFIESLKPTLKYALTKEGDEDSFDEEEREEEEDKDFILRKGAKNLSRADKAILVAAGIKGVLSKMGEQSNIIKELNFEQELNTKLKASIIIL